MTLQCKLCSGLVRFTKAFNIEQKFTTDDEESELIDS